MTFSILALVSTRDSHIKPDCEAAGLIPGPIWEMPCNYLFITYFEADEMRIYVNSDLKILSERLQGNNELRAVEDIPAAELNQYLAKFVCLEYHRKMRNMSSNIIVILTFS
jgi:hypothetical protein